MYMKLNKIKSLLMVATMTIGLVGCSSNNGIKGFEKNIDLAKTYEELKSDLSDLELSNDLGTQLNYENVKLGDNFIGTMIIHKNEDDDYIDYVSYDISSDNNLNTEEIISELTEIYGDPVHKENYNNNRIDVAYYLFRNGNVNISIPIRNTINTINYELVDNNADDIIKEQESLQKYRESNKEAQEAYDLLSSLADLEGKPITEAIENKRLVVFSELFDTLIFALNCFVTVFP